MKNDPIEEGTDGTARHTAWSPYEPGDPEGMPGQTARFFQPVGEPTPYLTVPGLTKHIKRILEEPPPALEISSEAIRRVAACQTAKDPENEVAELARNQFDAEPVRARRRATAAAGLKALGEWQKTEAEVRERLGQERLHATHLEKVPCASPAKRPLLPRVAATLSLLLYLTLFLLSLLAEARNAIWLVQAGLPEHFENDWLGAACLSLIYVAGPFVIYKLLFHNLTNKKRTRVLTLLKLFGMPLCLGGLGLFAWKMGVMQDPLPISKEPPFEPPFWAIVAVSMLLLAGTVMVLPVLMSERLDKLSGHEVTETKEWSAISVRLLQQNSVFSELVALRVRLEAIGTVLDAERADFVNRSVAELRFAREQLDARIRSTIHGPHSRASQTHEASGLLDSDRQS